MDSTDESDIDSTVTAFQPQDDTFSDFHVKRDCRSNLHQESCQPKHRSTHSWEKSSSADIKGLGSHGRKNELNHNYQIDPPDFSQGNLKEIYMELELITDKLKDENHILHNWETSLKEREKMLSISQGNLKIVIEIKVKQGVNVIEKKYKEEVAQLEAALCDRARENKRLKDNFETLKMAKDAQKKELESLKCQNEKLEKQSLSVQARLTNLQRKHEFEQRTRDADLLHPQCVTVSKAKPTVTMAGALDHSSEDRERLKTMKSEKVASAAAYELLLTLLDWVLDSQLRSTVIDNILKPVNRVASQEVLQEKVFKILPVLVDMLKEFPGNNTKLCLPCLQFTYWSLVHIDKVQGQQKSPLSSTVRRLGEELYQSKTVQFYNTDPCAVRDAVTTAVKMDKNKEGIYFRSSNLHVRLLSSLIILRTLSQVDLLVHAFDVLKADLKFDEAKQQFLYYQGTTVVLQFLKPVNRVFISPATDVFLQMTAHSPFASPFLESCSNETWFRTVAMVLRAPKQDVKILERLSIVLQNLSKIRNNKRYFEVYTITGIIQELVRGCTNDKTLLAQNLKSILYNLNSAT